LIEGTFFMQIGSYSYDEYLRVVKSFHGNLAPGLVVGDFIVDLALKNLPRGQFFDALCETSACLPDAVQLLTPCTIGNGWLKIVDMSRFAITLFEKEKGEGIRVYLDLRKLNAWPEFHDWYFKVKPKKEQNFNQLIEEIKTASSNVLGMHRVQVKPEYMSNRKQGNTAPCPSCGESYPLRDGHACLACQGRSPYMEG
jgi:formylmethanofuran dehydrogenase subunit E